VKVDVRNSYKMIIVDLTGSRRNNTNTILRYTLIDLSAGMFILLSNCKFSLHTLQHQRGLITLKVISVFVLQKKDIRIYTS
jgi:hypothetical protein